MKYIYCFLQVLVLIKFSIAQISDVHIKIDNRVKLSELNIFYTSGGKTYNLRDSVKDNIIELREPLCLPLSNIQISNYDGSLFENLYVTEKRAIIEVTKSQMDSTYKVEYNDGVYNFYDTAKNDLYKRLLIDTESEVANVQEFLDKHGNNANTNDSLMFLQTKLIKTLIEKELRFIKENHIKNNTFLFLFFKNRVGFTQQFIKNDPVFFNDLLDFYTFNFKEFESSCEGEILNNTLKNASDSLKIEDVEIITIDGKSIKISEFKGSYVLIDFWASWCIPCIEQIPILTKIHNTYGEKGLKIISISADHNPKKHLDAISKYMNNVNWIHSLDIRGLYQRKFNILVFPTYVLIDPKGKIILVSKGNLNEVLKILTNRL